MYSFKTSTMAVFYANIILLMSFFIISKALVLKVDLGVLQATTEPYYLSFTTDSSLLGTQPKWLYLDFKSPKLHTLLSALRPSIWRLGGSPADWTVFKGSKHLNASGIEPPFQFFTEKDLDDIISLCRATGTKFLFDFDLQLRYGTQWSPYNAAEMLDYIEDKQYAGVIHFELGNEPTDYSREGQDNFSAKQIADDFMTLYKLIRSYPGLNKSMLVGPDLVGDSALGKDMLYQLADHSGSYLNAITIHQYYFRGDIAKPKDYLNTSLFSELTSTVKIAQEIISNSSHPNLPIWIGETSDSWHGGTPNVSDRFISGFLWLDKLGLSAQLGVGVVIRQSLYGQDYSLLDIDMNPNPDYWLSYLYKTLVGSYVFKTYLDHATMNTTRLYAHCTNAMAGYPPGAITVYGLNIANTVSVIDLSEPLIGQIMESYIMTIPEGDSDGLLSRFTAVNKKVLKLVDTTLPKIVPTMTTRTRVLQLPAYSFSFFVFPKVQIKLCSSSR